MFLTPRSKQLSKGCWAVLAFRTRRNLSFGLVHAASHHPLKVLVWVHRHIKSNLTGVLVNLEIRASDIEGRELLQLRLRIYCATTEWCRKIGLILVDIISFQRTLSAIYKR